MRLAIRLLWLLLGCCASAAADELSIPLDNGVEIPVTRFGSSGPRLLWLPDAYGVAGDRHRLVAEAMAGNGLEVWLADLHSAYFVPHGRSSLSQLPIGDVSALIERSVPDDERRALYLLASGRGAALALLAARHWQQHYADGRRLAGAILLHPNLLRSVTRPGSPPDYYPVVDQTRLPLFILQPDGSARRWYLGDLTERLNQAGSRVFSLLLPGVRDGYHARADVAASETAETARLPERIHTALRLLASVPVAPPDQAVDLPDRLDIPPVEDTLQAVDPPIRAQALELTDLAGQPHRLVDLRGRVVLVNFWATWCPPCVEEIPSLGRMQARLADTDFTLLSVDIAESAAQVRRFLRDVPASFPVLMDEQGTTVRPWRIQAFPSTFLVDRDGRIRYSYMGGLEWDQPEVLEQVRRLLAE